MSELMKFIIPGLLVGVFIIRSSGNYTEVIFVNSMVNGKRYLVRNMNDKQEAADLLATISTKLAQLVQYLSQNVSKYPKKKGEIQRLVSRFNPDKVSERGTGFNYGEMSTYTVNKGEAMVFCLRTRDTYERLHDKNTLLFVAIHELTHIATRTEGHTEEFKANNTFLLKAAMDAGIYQYHDFSKDPKMYCGIMISNNVV